MLKKNTHVMTWHVTFMLQLVIPQKLKGQGGILFTGQLLICPKLLASEERVENKMRYASMQVTQQSRNILTRSMKTKQITEAVTMKH